MTHSGQLSTVAAAFWVVVIVGYAAIAVVALTRMSGRQR